MPVVQEYPVEGTQKLGPVPGEMVHTDASASEMGIAGAQNEALGKSMQYAGGKMSDIAIDMANRANEVRVQDALNQLRDQANKLAYDPQNGYMALKGQAALNPINSQSMPDYYTGQLSQTKSQIESSLGNDAQRRLFHLSSLSIGQEFQAGAERHAFEQSQVYGASVGSGTVQSETNSALLNYDNEDLLKAHAANAYAAIVSTAQRYQGKSFTEAQQDGWINTSHIYAGAIEQALKDPNGQNIAYAQKLFAEHADGGMTLEDKLRSADALRQVSWIGQNLTAVSAATQKYGSSFFPTKADRTYAALGPPSDVALKDVVAKLESGNSSDVHLQGKPIPPSKDYPNGDQAIGPMQVTTTTANNPGFGVQPWNGTDEDRIRVGKQLLDAYLVKYNGDIPKTLAAYNAGSGAVDSAVLDSDAGQWLSKLPQETQDYVAKGMKMMTDGGGFIPLPSKLAFQSEVINQLKAAQPNVMPAQISQAMELADKRYNDLIEARNTQTSNALKIAQSAVLQSHGDITAVPKDVLDQIGQGKPEELKDLTLFAEKVQDLGINHPPTPEAWKIYGQLVSDHSQLREMQESDLEKLRPEMGSKKLDQLLKLKGTLDGKPDPINTLAPTVGQSIDRFLSSIPSLQAKGVVGQRLEEISNRKLAISAWVKSELIDEQNRQGKAFNAVEGQEYASQLLNNGQTVQTTADRILGSLSLGLANPTTTRRNIDQIANIPSGKLNIIMARFKAAGMNPTDEQILGAYNVISGE